MRRLTDEQKRLAADLWIALAVFLFASLALELMLLFG